MTEQPGENFVDHVHSLLEALSNRTRKSRQWTAKAHDMLSSAKRVTLAEVNKLLSEVQHLDVEIEVPKHLYHIQPFRPDILGLLDCSPSRNHASASTGLD